MDETTLLPLNIHPGVLVYQDKCQRVYRTVAEFPDFTKEYFVSDRGQRAAVVVVNDGAVLLVRQYRLLIDRVSYEIPGGQIDKGETPEIAAIRECEEESGVKCLGLAPLLEYHPGLDTWKNYTYVYCTDRFIVPSDCNSGQWAWVPLQRCIAMIFSGEIVDSLSIIGLLAYNTSVTNSRDANTNRSSGSV